jgi:hypothetical protein
VGDSGHSPGAKEAEVIGAREAIVFTIVLAQDNQFNLLSLFFSSSPSIIKPAFCFEKLLALGQFSAPGSQYEFNLPVGCGWDRRRTKGTS